MSGRMPLAVLSAAAGLVSMAQLETAGAQSILASGSDAQVTSDGLHRVSPLLMEAAWVVEDYDLSGYRRLLLMPTAVQFRAVRKRSDDARSRAMTEEFSVDEDRQEWFRKLWRDKVEAQFSQDRVDATYTGDISDVLVIQGFLVDVVSRIPPNARGSA